MNRVSFAGHLPHLELLRGFAILFIVLFHFHTPYFCNGYYGVEIFLVISGFLLFNSHICKGVPPLVDFIRRKIFRIYPTLAVSVFLSAAFSLVLVTDSRELLDTFHTACHALIAHSNVFLDHNNDYFAPSSAANPLLHTWYISVTIQVYLLYIIVATFTKRISPSICIGGLVLLALLSLGDSYSARLLPFLHRWDADSSYYSVFSRLWEFIAGGIVFFLPDIPSERLKKGCSHICLFLLFIIVILPFEYGVSLSPLVVLLTVFFIRYADVAFFTRALSAPLLQLGKVSFSIYLIHYPVIVFAYNWCYRQPEAGTYLCSPLVIACAGYGLWYFIEKRAFPFSVVILLTGGSFAFAVTLTKADTIRDRIPESLAPYPQYLPSEQTVNKAFYQGLNTQTVFTDKGLLAILRNQRDGDYRLLMPIGNQKTEPDFLLIGDSNAQHLYAGMDKVLREGPRSGIFLCSRLYPLWGKTDADQTCDEAKIRDFLAYLEQQPKLKTIIISQLWAKRLNDELIDWNTKEHTRQFSENTRAFLDFCEEIRKRGKKIVLVAPIPRLYDTTMLNPLAYKRMAILKQEVPAPQLYPMTLDEYREKNSAILQLFAEIEKNKQACILWSENAFFHNSNTFYAIDTQTQEVLLRDPTHLTPPGSIQFMTTIKTELINALRR